MANIIYFGDSNLNSTSAHRAYALKRLGHNVDIRDPYEMLRKKKLFKWLEPIHYRTGYSFLQSQVLSWLNNVISTSSRPDLVWVDSGELFGVECLKVFKSLSRPVVLYNVDDPSGKRDGNKFNSLLTAILHYDLIVVVRKETKDEFTALGAKHVIQVFRSYDEVEHKPFNNESDIPFNFKSEVAFIGTWMRHEKRDEFLLELIKQGIPLSIWGGRWKKSQYWNQLESAYKGGALGGRDYVAAIQGAKLCLGLLSKGNRDLHTQRSLEVPFSGGLLCAERTLEHTKLYKEAEQAVFWSSVEECVKVCKSLLQNDSLRETIRLNGMHRVRELGLGNEDVCLRILKEINIS